MSLSALESTVNTAFEARDGISTSTKGEPQHEGYFLRRVALTRVPTPTYRQASESPPWDSGGSSKHRVQGEPGLLTRTGGVDGRVAGAGDALRRSHRAGPGPPQLQLYLATKTGSGTQLQPVTIASGT